MPSQRRLKTQENCRATLAWIFREVEKDKMVPTKARVLIYAALSISGIISETDIEARIKALEESAAQAKPTALRRPA
jgi:predicted NAD/FAD-dependent oxidoreductase